MYAHIYIHICNGNWYCTNDYIYIYEFVYYVLEYIYLYLRTINFLLVNNFMYGIYIVFIYVYYMMYSMCVHMFQMFELNYIYAIFSHALDELKLGIYLL